MVVSAQIAWDEIPCSAPVKPSPSSVVAFTLIWLTSICNAAAIFFSISSMYGRIFGFWAMIVASMFSTIYPFSSISFATCSNNLILEIPLYCGSVSGKCFPMSPSAAAPSSASMIACSKTSASECPKSPSVCGIFTPPRIRSLPSTNLWTSYPIPILIYILLAFFFSFYDG